MLNTYLKKILRKLNHHRTTEVYFIAYPKTGSTWIRLMLGRYIQVACKLPQLPLFDDTDWLGRCEKGCIGPAMQFTHRPLDWKTQAAADLNFDNVIRPFVNKKVVLIVRHPLDALVSNWFQEQNQVLNGFKGGLNEFLEHPVFGLNKFSRFHHLWAQCGDKVEGFCSIRYEDMKANPEKTLLSLLEFLNIYPDANVLRAAIDYASFDNMKKLEKSGEVPVYRSSGLRIFATGDKENPDAFHVRRGKVGGYRDYLDANSAKQYEKIVEQELGNWLGYKVNQW